MVILLVSLLSEVYICNHNFFSTLSLTLKVLALIFFFVKEEAHISIFVLAVISTKLDA